MGAPPIDPGLHVVEERPAGAEARATVTGRIDRPYRGEAAAGASPSIGN